MAATATVYALMCLAAAALATTVFGGALMGGTPAQFLKAAALFGAVAVGTALAGRAVAGDSFSQTTSGGGSGSSDSSRPGINSTERFNGFGNEMRQLVNGVKEEFRAFRQQFTPKSADAVLMAAVGSSEGQKALITGLGEGLQNGATDLKRAFGDY